MINTGNNQKAALKEYESFTSILKTLYPQKNMEARI